MEKPYIPIKPKKFVKEYKVINDKYIPHVTISLEDEINALK